MNFGFSFKCSFGYTGYILNFFSVFCAFFLTFVGAAFCSNNTREADTF